MQSHLAYKYVRICVLIRNAICESLVKIERFKHEWSTNKCENLQNSSIYSKIFNLTSSSIWHIITSKFVYWLKCNFWMFSGNKTFQTWIIFKYLWKSLKYINLVIYPSITCCYIADINMSVCVYWLEIQFEKVC